MGPKEYDSLPVGTQGVNLQEDRLGISPPPDAEGHVLAGSQMDILPSHGLEPLFQYGGIGPAPGSMIEDGRRGGRLIDYRSRQGVTVGGPDLSFLDLEAKAIAGEGDFLQMVLPDERPFLLLVQGLDQLLDRDKALFVQYQAVFVGPMSQDVGQQLAEPLSLVLVHNLRARISR